MYCQSEHKQGAKFKSEISYLFPNTKAFASQGANFSRFPYKSDARYGQEAATAIRHYLVVRSFGVKEL